MEVCIMEEALTYYERCVPECTRTMYVQFQSYQDKVASGKLYSWYYKMCIRDRKIPVRASFPAHREAGEDFYQRIDQLLEHHRCRLDEIQQTVIDHPGITAYETAGLIHWSLRGLSWEMFPYNQRWFAMAETLAHLYYLVDAQRIARDESGEFVRYYCWQ